MEFNLELAFSKKNILVTGGTGLIGIPLVRKLLKSGAHVTVVSLDASFPFGDNAEFINGDICDMSFCRRIMSGKDFVFHLAGIKGGIGVARTKAANFLIKNIVMNTNVMEAAREASVKKFLYASSICVYPPAEVFKEENAWTGLPHISDRFGGMAKLVGEMQIEAYKLQYGLDNFLIARPANTYGPYDNFDKESALVIPALIKRVIDGENPLKIWGDGSAVRDFVYSDDVADFLMLMVAKDKPGPYNVGSGMPVTIKEVAENIVKISERVTNKRTVIEWESSKPTGEKHRVTSIEKAVVEIGWKPKVSMEDGISKTVEWYYANKDRLLKRYSIISE